MRTPDLHKRILVAFMPYEQEWEDWKLSDYCFLDRRNIIATELFLRTGSIKDVAFRIRKTETTAKEHILHSTIRLETSLPIFQEWKAIKNTPRENNLLLAPIKCLPLSIALRNRLGAIGDTLEEILNTYTRQELYRIRNMGEKKMQELYDFLNSIDAYHLLRDSEEFSNTRQIA